MPRFLLLLLATLCGCVSYARRTGSSHFVDPASQAPSPGDERPLVMLVTGSMIVSDFFGPLKERLEREGYAVVLFQPHDLFTGGLVEGATEVRQAVEGVLAASGRDHLSILAECNGGIASRWYVEQLGGHAHVDRLVTFVSGHNGSGNYVIAWFPSLRDLKPGSDFMHLAAASRLPAGASTMAVSLFACGDEVMDPDTTSAYPGAINIEVCDPRVTTEALAFRPYDVDHFLGNRLFHRYPLHFTGFWQDGWADLFVSALRDDEETIRGYSGMAIQVHDLAP